MKTMASGLSCGFMPHGAGHVKGFRKECWL
eukprot:Nitzschia sp. Nitz4//scaffold81_size91200//62966//63055//NITZ4_004992-RA/size91200-exonerate_protein2genome-gene-0.25-mRNA-1//1//CDS//3329558728//91//frame0